MPIFPHDGDNESLQVPKEDVETFDPGTYDSLYDEYWFDNLYYEECHLDHCDYSENLWNEC